MSYFSRIFVTATLTFVALCIAGFPQQTQTADPELLGFTAGVMHGVIIPVSFFFGLFVSPEIRVYAYPNVGTWYDVGYVFGIFILGVFTDLNRIKRQPK